MSGIGTYLILMVILNTQKRSLCIHLYPVKTVTKINMGYLSIEHQKLSNYEKPIFLTANNTPIKL